MENEPRPPLITGTEMEWGLELFGARNGNHIQNPNLIWPDMQKYMDTPFIGQYGGNGCRLYVDFGAHLEYATPEDISFMNTVKNEIAGENMVRRLLELGVLHERISDFRQNKRLVDSKGETWGHHESYGLLAERMSVNVDLLELLGIHIATRNIWAGAGSVAQDESGDLFYETTQKASRVHNDYGIGTTNQQKAIVNLRNEPLSGGDYVRVHVTAGEANMSPWAMWMTLGSTALVLRLIEEGHVMEELAPNSELVSVAKTVGYDTSLNHRFSMANGANMTAMDIQESLVERVVKHEAELGLNKEEQAVLVEWQRAIDNMRQDPELLVDRVDWIAKRQKIREYVDQTKREDITPGVLAIDRLWGEISDRGIGLRMREGPWKVWMPTEAAIDDAMVNPPSDTRAAVRGAFIHAYGKRDNVKVSWDQVNYGAKKIMLSDPHDKEIPPALAQLLEAA